jgi:outer membrane protein assembly factor BamB
MVLLGLIFASGVAAGDNDWPQRYGDAANTNVSACWLEPPLVEVWRQALAPTQPLPSVASAGVWCAPLIEARGPGVVGVSAAAGTALWEHRAAASTPPLRAVSVVGSQLLAEWCGTPCLSWLDLVTGRAGGDLGLTVCSPGTNHAVPVRPSSLSLCGGDTVVLSNRNWTGAYSLRRGQWLWHKRSHSLEPPLYGGAALSAVTVDPLRGQRKPAFAGDIVAIGPYSGWFGGFRAADGEPLWLRRPGAEKPGQSCTMHYVGAGPVPPVLLKGYECFGSALISRGSVLCPLGEGGVAALSAGDGALRWAFDDRWARAPDAMVSPYMSLALAESVNAVLYPSFDGNLYCFDLDTGAVRWAQPWAMDGSLYTKYCALRAFAPVVTEGDRPQVVYLRGCRALTAFDVRDGTVLWQQELPPSACAPAVHGGALYVTSGEFLDYMHTRNCSASCFAPTVRLYRLGFGLPVESDTPLTERKPPWPAKDAPEIVKLTFGLEPNGDEKDLKAWLAQQEWPQAGCQALVTVDWLTDDVDLSDRTFTLAKRVADRCRELARTFEPAYFDLAPEANVYLRAHPDQAKELLEVLARARGRVKEASPQTRVLVSLQYELWQGWNSHFEGAKRKPDRLGELRGILPTEKLTTQVGIAQLLDGVVDCFGISTDPSVIAQQPADLPLDYYYRIANATKKPLLFTDVRWPAGADRKAQEEFVDVLSRRAYWLDPAAVIWPAYDPDTAKELGCEGYALAAAKGAAPPKAWQDLVGWRTLPQRPQPGPPIVLAKAEEGF